MDIGEINIGGEIWKTAPSLEYVKDESLEGYFFSWGEFSVPSQYVHCDGNNLAIRKCTFNNQIFINCNFDMIDASDSTFIDCLFLNCTFKNANFHKSTFIGSCLRNEVDTSIAMNDSLAGAGMSQSRFKSSNKNKAVLSNLNLKSCGFRHSIFDHTILNNVIIEYTSFEDAYLNQCEIDKFDLCRSACRGIIINDCKIAKYISSVEKTLGAIGALQILENCYEIELNYSGDKISNEKQLVSKLQESSSNFLNEGKLYEFFNIMLYMLKKKGEIEIEKSLDSKFELDLLSDIKNIDGYPVSIIGKQLLTFTNQAYESIIQNGKTINLDDILYSLKLMYFLEINEYVLLKFFLDIFNLEVEQRNSDYSDFLIISQIRQYFYTIGERIKGNKYVLRFHNSNALWKEEKDRNEFYEFCRIFIEEGINEQNYHLISMHEGSIDAIFESLFNIQNILIAAAILGCEFEVKDNKISFRFSVRDGIKSYTRFLKELVLILPFFGNKKPTENEFNNGFERMKGIADKIKPYLKKNKIEGDIRQNNASKIIEETIKTSSYFLNGKKDQVKIESSEIHRKRIE